MFWLGCGRPDGKRVPLHNAEFDPGEDIIPLGVEVMATSALRFLETE